MRVFAGKFSLFILLLWSVSAHAILFDLSWEGAEGYSMTGQFSYDNSLIGTGVIGARDLDSFYIDVLQYGASLGDWDFVRDGLSGTAFNFNFDTVTEAFMLGGSLFSANGQYWNMAGTTCNGAGFRSSQTMQLVCADGVWRPESVAYISQNPLSVSRHVVESVPEPRAAALLFIGCLSLFGIKALKGEKLLGEKRREAGSE